MASKDPMDRVAQGRSEVLWPAGGPDRAAFVGRVCEEGAAHYRDLPWRHIDDPYAVLVSEVMLQQTQVVRVERFWRRFLEAFPTIDALAAASTSDVLERWQGLGYNRRALALKRAADVCAADFDGALPTAYDDLVSLPGIGPATAAGVRAFAFGCAGVYLETNVRAVFIHELFPGRDAVSDKELVSLVADVCPPSRREGAGSPRRSGSLASPGDLAKDPCDWYYALLDYGAALKASGVNPTRRSAHYARQSTFEGSRRQKRAWIVRRVLAAGGRVGAEAVFKELNEVERKARRAAVDDALFRSIVDDLVREGFFRREEDWLFS